MNYYKIKFEDSSETFDWYKSLLSYLSDDEYMLMSIHEHHLLEGVQPISEVYRMDQINFAGGVKETKIFPNKELEQSLLNKKQKHWH